LPHHSGKAVDGPWLRHIDVVLFVFVYTLRKKRLQRKLRPRQQKRPFETSINEIFLNPLELSINGYIKPCLPPAIVSFTLDPTGSYSHTIFTSQYSVSSNTCIALPLISFTYIKTRHYPKNAVPVARLRDGFECHTRCSDECPGGSIVCASSGLPLKTFGIPSWRLI
jgi:hypothetical protein